MAEADVLPGAVRLKVGRPDGDGGGVVGRAGRVDSAIESEGQGSVVEGVVLGVAADADVGLGAGDAADVVQQGV